MNLDGWMVWIVIAMVLFIIELLTPGTFYFFCLGIGAVFAAVATVFDNRPVTWLAFFAVSLAMVLISRPVVKKINASKTRETNTDALKGKNGVVTSGIDRYGKGMVKVEGEVWRAKADISIEKGRGIRVIKSDGNFLLVEEAKE